MPQFLPRSLGFTVLLALAMIAVVLITALLLRARERRHRAKAPIADAFHLDTVRVPEARLCLVSAGEGESVVIINAIFPLPDTMFRVLHEAKTSGTPRNILLVLDRVTYRLSAPVVAYNVISTPSRRGNTRLAAVVFGPATLTPHAV